MKQPHFTQKQYREDYLDRIQSLDLPEALDYINKEIEDLGRYVRLGWNPDSIYTRKTWELDNKNQRKVLNEISKKLTGLIKIKNESEIK